MEDRDVVVKQGTFLYADEVICDIRIVKTAIRYGTGDYEDPPEFQQDQEGEFYYIEFGSSTQRDEYSSRSFTFYTLEEAIKEAEEAAGNSLKWIS